MAPATTPQEPGETAVSMRRAVSSDVPAIARQRAEAQWSGLADTERVERELELFSGWVAEAGGEVVGAMLSVPFEQWVAGVSLKMAGIRAVTCALHARRRGVVDKMLRHALHELRETHDVSTLWPFSPPFYERYEYGVCGRDIGWRLLLEDLVGEPPPTPPRRLDTTHVDLIRELIRAHLDRLGNGAILPERYWIERQYFPRSQDTHEPITYGWFEGEALVAVVTLSSVEGGGENTKNALSASNVLARDEIWTGFAWGFLKSFADQYVEVVTWQREADLFFHRIRKPYRYVTTVFRPGHRERGTEYEPNWQARLLRPDVVLAQPRALHGDGGTLAVALTDSVFQDLNGQYEWTLGQSPGWRVATPAAAALPQASMSMAELSRLWYGGAQVYELRRAGRLRCDDAAARILHGLSGFRCDMQVGF